MLYALIITVTSQFADTYVDQVVTYPTMIACETDLTPRLAYEKSVRDPNRWTVKAVCHVVIESGKKDE